MLFEWLHAYDWESEQAPKGSFAHSVILLEEEEQLETIRFAFLGVEEARGDSHSRESEDAPDAIRRELGNLQMHFPKNSVGDLGNLRPGATISDTYYALEEIVAFCCEREIALFILGGSQDLSFSQMRGLKALKEPLNIVIVDRAIDMLDEPELNSGNFIHQMVTQEDQFVFNLSHLAGQMHFIEAVKLHCMERMNFDIQRLGDLQEDITRVEPEVRDAHLISFDVNAIRFADMPGQREHNPNGLFGEQACRIMRYAGISDSMKVGGLFGFSAERDESGAGANLAAQLLWYFMDGVFARKNDAPNQSDPDYLKYNVAFEEEEMEIVFLKSKRSERWWMEVEYFKEGEPNIQLVSCDYNDYSMAMQGNIPERWFRANEKLV